MTRPVQSGLLGNEWPTINLDPEERCETIHFDWMHWMQFLLIHSIKKE
jgi:hypothetical protein